MNNPTVNALIRHAIDDALWSALADPMPTNKVASLRKAASALRDAADLIELDAKNRAARAVEAGA